MTGAAARLSFLMLSSALLRCLPSYCRWHGAVMIAALHKMLDVIVTLSVMFQHPLAAATTAATREQRAEGWLRNASEVRGQDTV